MKVSLEETCGDEELLHGHGVHAGEVLHHQGLAVLPVAQAEVLLEVDGHLGDHDGVLDVHLDPLQALDALLAGVPGQGQLVNPKFQIL